MYTISFEVIGVALSIIFIIVHSLLFGKKGVLDKVFFIYTVSVAFECSLDIFTAKMIDGALNFSDNVSIWINTVYLTIALISAYFGYRIIAIRLKYQSKFSLVLSRVLLEGGALFILLNPILGHLFVFSNGEYVKNPIFPVVYVLSFSFVFMVPFVLIKSKDAGNSERFAVVYYLTIIIVTFALQMIFPSVLLTGLGKAIGGMIFCMYMETPEHERLRVAVHELETAQKEKLMATEEANEAIQQKNEFLVRMSHALRTPINAIMGFDEMILNECEEPILHEDAVKLGVSGEKLLDLVEEIVDFSQIETGKLELREKEYLFETFYLETSDRFKKYIADDKYNFDINISEEIPKRLYGDEKRVRQIIEKLVSYICKKMERGTIKIDCGVDFIEDNQAYFAASVYTSEKLVITEETRKDLDFVVINSILECMGSELQIIEKEDGMSFHFVLVQEIVDLKPIGNIEEAIERFRKKEEADSKKNAFVMPKARILSVDDTVINLKVLEGLLKPLKVNVTSVTSGKEAIEIMKKESFDLVFMDILMPKMDGVETLKAIRSDGDIISKEAPMIALTANVFIGAREKYLSDGFADYITKPVSGSTVSSCLNTFLPHLKEHDWATMEVTKDEEEAPKDTGTKKYTSFLGGKKEESKPKKYTSFLGKKEEPAKNVESVTIAPVSEPDASEAFPGYDLQAGLSLCMGDMSLYQEIVRDYCTNGVDTKLRTHYENKDWDNYRILIHGAKSSSKTVGLMEQYEKALALEDAARRLDIEYIDLHHEEWIQSYKDAVNMLQSRR